MFYSHTFLARKGPLGTVWCAAHLQHRLKKSHYTSTDISSTVDRIMFPEVPIALRMSGHLLLGIVRIYSKKVDYLLHDCKGITDRLTKAFATVDINLPEDAAQAPAQSVTLPEKFDLDALNMDDNIYNEGSPDRHLRNQEDITLPDQVPTGGDQYVTITFEEDIMMDSTHEEEDRVPESTRMEDDMQRAPPLDTVAVFGDSGPNIQTQVPSEIGEFQDPGTSNQKKLPTEADGLGDATESNQQGQTRPVDFQEPDLSGQTENLNLGTTDSTPQSLPRFMAGPVHDVDIGIARQSLPESDIGFSSLEKDATQPIESADRIFSEDIPTPNLEDALASKEQSVQFQLHSQKPASAGIGPLPEMALRSSPPVQQQKPRARKRKLDERIVLSNKFMKEALKNHSDLVQKRRKMPNTALGMWKLNKRAKKDQVFHEPLITGFSTEISTIFETDIASKPQFVVMEDTIPEAVATNASAPAAEDVPNAGVVYSPTRETEIIPESRAAETSDRPTEAVTELRAGQPSEQAADIDMGTPEHLRHTEAFGGDEYLQDPMPPASGAVPSPLGRDDLTPFSTKSLGSESMVQFGTNMGTDTLSTQDIATSAGIHGSEFVTPGTHSEEQLGQEYSGQSGNFELRKSAEAEDLHFLEADNNTPTVSQASQGIDSLSVRTRAVAQYLQRKSSITPVSEGPSATPVSEDQSTHLSLDNILEGKPRKLAARMFFEILVLKSHGLIDVHQEEPYGDIDLELTPMLKKTHL